MKKLHVFDAILLALFEKSILLDVKHHFAGVSNKKCIQKILNFRRGWRLRRVGSKRYHKVGTRRRYLLSCTDDKIISTTRKKVWTLEKFFKNFQKFSKNFKKFWIFAGATTGWRVRRVGSKKYHKIGTRRRYLLTYTDDKIKAW